MFRLNALVAVIALAMGAGCASAHAQGPTKEWPQWGRTARHSNVGRVTRVPLDFSPGEFDRQTRTWNPETARHVRWVADLGSQSYGSPVIAHGRVFIATNNGRGYLERLPSKVDLGVLLCFSAVDGSFLWQYSSAKLATGRVHDWPLQGICSTPLVEDDRLWLVTNRCEVVCLDTVGFYDMKDDGPFDDGEDALTKRMQEADVVWKLNMMAELGVSPHNMSNCSPVVWGDTLFICTSNGVDNSHITIPAPDAPAFIALDKHTGKLLWSDNSPGKNILHGQWCSPAVAELGGVPQVIFGGGDGWLYSFRADRYADGKPELLWKFDGNPKDSKWILGGRGTRNNIVSTPVIYNERVYITMGQDPEHGEGVGHLWCIDPTKRGDISGELAVGADGKTPIPRAFDRRMRAIDPDLGEMAIANPNSGVVWHNDQLLRTISAPANDGDLLFINDFSGFFHCLDVHTGKQHWEYDLLAAAWSSPVIVNNRVFMCDEDGDVAIFAVSKDARVAFRAHDEPLAEINMGNTIYATPAVAGDTIYIPTRTHLFAIDASRN